MLRLNLIRVSIRGSWGPSQYKDVPYLGKTVFILRQGPGLCSFQTLAASVIGLGFLFTIIFHVGTREPPTPRENDTSAPYSSIPSETISSNNPNETTPDLNNQGEYPDDQRSPNNETDTLSLVTDSAKVYSDISPPDGISVAEPRREKWYQWLKFPQFYQVSGTFVWVSVGCHVGCMTHITMTS